MFQIEMLAAGHGDSLLITYGDPATPHHVLIDGGPYYAYQNQQLVEQQTVSKRIQQIADRNRPLELLVITHIDADHIEGVVKLLANRPSHLEIKDVWFNAWRHLTPRPADLLGPIHGEMVSALLQQANIPWNRAFGGSAVVVASGQPLPVISLVGGMQLTLLSPTRAILADLSHEWATTLRKAGLDPDSPEQALERLKKSRLRPDDLLGEPSIDIDGLAEEPFRSDSELPNGSSIAFIAEFEGKSCLLAGDAHASVLEDSIRTLLHEQGIVRLHLDAFKLPHHGSKKNLGPALLKLLECERYLVSTNGNYFGHPDRQTIARIIVNGSPNPVLYFNYRTKENTIWDDANLKRQYRYQVIYGDEEHGGLTVDLGC